MSAARLLPPLATAVVVLAYPWTGLPLRYLANDDLGLIAFLAQDCDPVFFSVLLGRVLRAAYRIGGPEAPLFPLFLNATLALSAAVFVHLLPARSGRGWRHPGVWLAAGIYASVFVFFLSAMTFTLSAAALAAHGGLWLLLGESRRSAWLAAGLVALGMLVRLEAAALAALLLLVPGSVRLRREPLPLLKRLLPLAACVLVTFAAERVAQHVGVTPAHREFQAFNALRGRLHSFPLLDQHFGNPALLAANGWTETDYLLFVNWVFPDERKYNGETLGNFFRLPPPPRAEQPRRPARSTAERLRYFAWDYSYYCGGIALLVVLGLSLRGWTPNLLLQAQALWMLLLGLYLEFFLRFPMRVRESALLAGLLGAFALLRLLDARRASGRRGGIGPAAALVFLLWRSGLMLSWLLTLRWDQGEMVRWGERFGARYPRQIAYFWHTYAPRLEILHPLRRPEFGFEIMLHGWTTFSEPFYADIQRRLGIRRGQELLPALAHRPDVVLVAPAAGAEAIATALRESHGIAVTPRRLEVEDGIEYWRLEPTVPPHPAAVPPGPPD
jgi:hypothetical protein